MSGSDEYKAPTGKFRVMAEDTFPWPPEEKYFVGDFDELETAKAEDHAEEFTVVSVYDDTGKLVY